MSTSACKRLSFGRWRQATCYMHAIATSAHFKHNKPGAGVMTSETPGLPASTPGTITHADMWSLAASKLLQNMHFICHASSQDASLCAARLNSVR